METDALTKRFGKDKKGRTRGVGSKVPFTRLKATIPIRNELQKVQAQVEANSDTMGSIRKDLNQILKYMQVFIYSQVLQFFSLYVPKIMYIILRTLGRKGFDNH